MKNGLHIYVCVYKDRLRTKRKDTHIVNVIHNRDSCLMHLNLQLQQICAPEKWLSDQQCSQQHWFCGFKNLLQQSCQAYAYCVFTCSMQGCGLYVWVTRPAWQHVYTSQVLDIHAAADIQRRDHESNATKCCLLHAHYAVMHQPELHSLFSLCQQDARWLLQFTKWIRAVWPSRHSP